MLPALPYSIYIHWESQFRASSVTKPCHLSQCQQGLAFWLREGKGKWGPSLFHEACQPNLFTVLSFILVFSHTQCLQFLGIPWLVHG